MNNAPFTVGQKVVCLVDITMLDHKMEPESTFFKSGDVVTVLGSYKCCTWRIDIGIKKPPRICLCPYCLDQSKDNVVWCEHTLFAPIEENTYEDVRKQLAVLPQDEVPDVKHVKELS